MEWKCDQFPNPDVTLVLSHQVIHLVGDEVWIPVPPEFAKFPDVTFSVPFTDRNYWRVFGTDYLVIEGNQIGLLDLDETEFAIKEYPLAASPSEQRYRAYGIIVADNELFAGHAHRQVFIRKNRITYVDGVTRAPYVGIGLRVAECSWPESSSCT